MSLFKQIKADQLQARKDKDILRINLLTTLIGEIQTFVTGGMTASQHGLVSSIDSDDKNTITIIKKFVKNAEKSLSLRETDQVKAELTILKSYMPQPLTEEEVKALVSSYILVAKSESVPQKALLGFVMKEMKEGYPDRYQSTHVKELVLAHEY